MIALISRRDVPVCPDTNDSFAALLDTLFASAINMWSPRLLDQTVLVYQAGRPDDSIERISIALIVRCLHRSRISLSLMQAIVVQLMPSCERIPTGSAQALLLLTAGKLPRVGWWAPVQS